MDDSALRWKVLTSEYLARRPWFTVRRERVELPNGHIVPEYYVLEYPEWIGVIALTPDDRMVMVYQYRHALGRAAFELPAGACEPDDQSLLASAQRELREETGYAGTEWEHFMDISPNPATNTNLTHVFLLRNATLQSAQQLDEGENLSVHLLRREEVFGLLERGEIIQSLMAAPLWKFFYRERSR